MACRFRMTRIVSAKALFHVRARSHISAAGFDASQDIDIKHRLNPRRFYKIGPAGFEPATCRRGDRAKNPSC